METDRQNTLTGRDRRTEARQIIDEYYSVQFFIKHLETIYQFILWDISSQGMCILVDNESDVLAYLSVGDVFKTKYYPRELYGEARIRKTEIRHISKGTGTRFSDYHMVGLKILE